MRGAWWMLHALHSRRGLLRGMPLAIYRPKAMPHAPGGRALVALDLVAVHTPSQRPALSAHQAARSPLCASLCSEPVTA